MLLWLIPGTVIPLTLGRKMMQPARQVNNKVLYDTARMLAANWQTSLAAAIGIGGIAFGVWWLDSLAAIFIAGSVMSDGVRNTRRTAGGLMDRMPTKIGSDEIVDLVGDIEQLVEEAGWTRDAEVRLREEGAMYSGEVLLGTDGQLDIDRFDALTRRIHQLDWRLREVLVVPVKREQPGDVERASRSARPEG